MRRLFFLCAFFLVTGLQAQESLKCILNKQTTTAGGTEGSGTTHQLEMVLVALSDNVQIDNLVAETSPVHKKLCLQKGDTLTMSYSYWEPPFLIDDFLHQDFLPEGKIEVKDHQKKLQDAYFENISYTYSGKKYDLVLPAREEIEIDMP